MPGQTVLVERMKSIVQAEEDRCFVCGSRRDLELHHIMHGTANRRLSTQWGLVCMLCHTHHTGRLGVHYDPILNERLQKEAQKAFESRYGHTRWMVTFRKNYL